MGHVTLNTPLLRVICPPYAGISYSISLYKFGNSSSMLKNVFYVFFRHQKYDFLRFFEMVYQKS